MAKTKDALGARHGLFCVACCWALMLVQFATGVANLVWMAPLTLVMLNEKTERAGDRATISIRSDSVYSAASCWPTRPWLPCSTLGG